MGTVHLVEMERREYFKELPFQRHYNCKCEEAEACLERLANLPFFNNPEEEEWEVDFERPAYTMSDEAIAWYKFYRRHRIYIW